MEPYTTIDENTTQRYLSSKTNAGPDNAEHVVSVKVVQKT